jgi:hypothetical protein
MLGLSLLELAIYVITPAVAIIVGLHALYKLPPSPHIDVMEDVSYCHREGMGIQLEFNSYAKPAYGWTPIYNLNDLTCILDLYPVMALHIVLDNKEQTDVLDLLYRRNRAGKSIPRRVTALSHRNVILLQEENIMTYTHKKTGRKYTVLHANALNEADMSRVVIYRAEQDGEIWVRDRAEFFDGRFVPEGEL